MVFLGHDGFSLVYDHVCILKDCFEDDPFFSDTPMSCWIYLWVPCQVHIKDEASEHMEIED